MHTIVKRLPSPALFVACVALVVALGGVSYAASVLPKNSVGTAQLKKKSVTSSKVREGAITTTKVKDGTLLGQDFRAGQLPAGPQGPKGEKGDPGATQVTQRSNQGLAKGAGEYSVTLAGCQPGETLVGGGAYPKDTFPAKPTLVENGPVSATSWRVSYRNDGAAGTVAAVAYALCASP